MTIPESTPDFIDAKSRNGYLIHAVRPVWAFPDRHEDFPNDFRAFLVTSRALCGVTGKDGWGGGWMRGTHDDEFQAVEFDDTRDAGSRKNEDGSMTYFKVCAKCRGRVRVMRRPV